MGSVILCLGGGGREAVLCIVGFCSILGPYPLDASSNLPNCDNHKCLQPLSNVSWGTTLLLIENCCLNSNGRVGPRILFLTSISGKSSSCVCPIGPLLPFQHPVSFSPCFQRPLEAYRSVTGKSQLSSSQARPTVLSRRQLTK